MQLAVVLAILIAATPAHAEARREGFVFGAAAGVSLLRYEAITDGAVGAPSFPNFKLGAMVGSHTAVLALLPGTLFEYRGDSRPRDRGFEGVFVVVQHWLAPRWWVLGGAGLGLDAPAFYDIEAPAERTFHFGAGGVVGTGYEVWTHGRFALDVQGRLHGNAMYLPEGTRRGLAASLLVGVTWY